MKAGDRVKIKGRVAVLVSPVEDVDGGWWIDRPVQGFRCWNELDMKPNPPPPTAHPKPRRS